MRYFNLHIVHCLLPIDVLLSSFAPCEINLGEANIKTRPRPGTGGIKI
jgi:hypothetical protein